jgi:hypothetical protein
VFSGLAPVTGVGPLTTTVLRPKTSNFAGGSHACAVLASQKQLVKPASLQSLMPFPSTSAEDTAVVQEEAFPKQAEVPRDVRSCAEVVLTT